MGKNRDKRVSNLENDIGGGDETLIVVDWDGPTVTVKGEVLTRAEYEKRYPNPKVIRWEDLSDDEELTPIPVG